MAVTSVTTRAAAATAVVAVGMVVAVAATVAMVVAAAVSHSICLHRLAWLCKLRSSGVVCTLHCQLCSAGSTVASIVRHVCGQAIVLVADMVARMACLLDMETLKAVRAWHPPSRLCT